MPKWLTPRLGVLLALAVGGVYLVTDVRLAGEPVGVALGFANAGLFALYIVLGHRLSRQSGLGGLYDILGPNNFTVEDASYAKIRELLVSYRLGPIGGQGDWEISLVGRNLWTITGYRGFDPEVGIGTFAPQPGAATVLGNSGGQAASGAVNAVDAFSFPNTRSFTLGLTTSF